MVVDVFVECLDNHLVNFPKHSFIKVYNDLAARVQSLIEFDEPLLKLLDLRQSFPVEIAQILVLSKPLKMTPESLSILGTHFLIEL